MSSLVKGPGERWIISDITSKPLSRCMLYTLKNDKILDNIEYLFIDTHSRFDLYSCLCWQSVWVKKGAMQWWRDWKPHKWIDVHFALEQFSGAEGHKDGILFIYYNYYEEKKVRM